MPSIHVWLLVVMPVEKYCAVNLSSDLGKKDRSISRVGDDLRSQPRNAQL